MTLHVPKDCAIRRQALLDALRDRILVLDGATGTAMQSQVLTAEDFGGEDLDGCNENLCATRPDVVAFVHRTYLSAGADIVETNTFGATPLVLAEYGLEAQTFELNRLAAEIARKTCLEFEDPSDPVPTKFVCGSAGPTTKAISVTGGVTFEELIWHFEQQALGLLAGGADYLLLETCQDTRNIKAGLIGFKQAFEQAGWSIPVAVSVTIETMGTMLGGQDAEALAISLMGEDLLYVGLNCATGPEYMADHLRTLSELCRTRVAAVPNAGLPDENGEYQEGPEVFKTVFSRFLDAGWINLVGGCCGTTDKHVSELAALVRGEQPREIPQHNRALVSGLEGVELHDDNRPLLIGERTNVLGSRKFKQLIAKGDFEAAAEVGRKQVRGGAQIIDVCLQDPDRDEVADVEEFLEQVIRRVKVPLMIDSTDEAVMARALTYCQGKSILNSVNLEDGLERFEKVVPLAKRFGCALVVGLIDEEGMAVTVERKLEVANRSYKILTEDFGVEPQDIWFDPLVFPCGTGDANYIGSAKATIEGVRAIKEAFPLARTTLGISNVSFGLPNAGREILNSAFLYHCTRAGLDSALVNTEKLARYAEIPPEDRALAELLLDLEVGQVAEADSAVEKFAAHFRGRKSAVVAVDRNTLPLEERIARNVIEGSKEGLIDDLELARTGPENADKYPAPLDIINGPLMTGMAEVGRLFNANELIVAEVLQSAEVMKAAVNHLEQFMEKTESSSRGKVILATVKGDVHDIGKNLVDIILSNNGFEVINLGIKVPNDRLIAAAREHQPDLIGLSGLLVKSAQMMITAATDLAAAGVDTDLLVGGAALTRRFTHLRIAKEYGGVCTYAKDAMHGLSLAERLCDQNKRPEMLAEVAALVAGDEKVGAKPKQEIVVVAGTSRSSKVSLDVAVPKPADLERHVEQLDLEQVWHNLNLQMLFGRHLGLKGSVEKLRAAKDEKLGRLEELLVELKEEARNGAITASGVWQFFPAEANGNTLTLREASDRAKVVAEWSLPRQAKEDGLCLTDYVLDGDHVALFVVTAGVGIRDRVEHYKAEGEFLRSHGLAALALETAEAAAESVHTKLRSAWGFPDPEEMSARDRLIANYRGKRYSFGYPACPDLEHQRPLFDALKPQEIGAELTEGDMMEPEATVSALVFHHPDARYFGV